MSHSPRAAKQQALIRLAATWFREGRRIDLGQLAAAQGIGRATIYRWFDSRERVIGEAIWLGMAQAIARVEDSENAAPIDGRRDRARFIVVFERLAAQVRSYPPLGRFAAEDPELAMRVLQSSDSVIQRRLIDWVERWLSDIDVPAAGRAGQIPRSDLAYAMVRMAESFLWSDLIIGHPADPGKATAMIELLLRGADSLGPGPGPEPTEPSGRAGAGS